MKITLPIPPTAKGKDVSVYRIHDGVAEAIPLGEAKKNTDGEYIITINNTIVIYAKKFSQYAIAYTNSSSRITSGYTITVNQSEGGKISPDTLSVNKYNSMTFTITPDEDYEIQDVLVNGKSVGVVTEYTFENVITNTAITAKFKKVEEEPTIPNEPTTPEKWKILLQM